MTDKPLPVLFPELNSYQIALLRQLLVKERQAGYSEGYNKDTSLNLTERERLILLFELRGSLEAVNKSLKTGDDSFAGEDEAIMSIITKLEKI